MSPTPSGAVIPADQSGEGVVHSDGWEAGADAMVVALMPKLQRALRTAAERLYEEVLDTAEEYLKDNVRYNVQSAIDSANRQALSDRQALRVANDEIERLKSENRDLRAIPWPRAYVMDRASEWDRLLRETYGYIHTCRGSCGSDMSGRDHALAALSEARKMLIQSVSPSTCGTQPGTGEVNP